MNKACPKVVLAVVAALAATLGSTAVADGRDDPASEARPPLADTFVRSGSAVEGFIGTDGVFHEPAPEVVDGLDGEMYFGVDFDVACAFGEKYRESMSMVSKLAKVIARSGRRVVWTVAPSKTGVVDSAVDPTALPHGACDRRGMRQQNKIIDDYRDQWFLPLLSRLKRDPRQMYWKTDPHWTTVGGAHFARRLAMELDPELGKRQRYRLGTQTAVGLFNFWRDDSTPETVMAAFPRVRVKVRTTAHSEQDYTTFPDLIFDHSWVSRPAKRTWPGRTLLIGDSMGIYALENLRPIFHRGRYMWIDHVSRDDLVDAIVRADTVVLEKFQTYLPFRQGLTDGSLRRAVAKALRKHPAEG